MSSVRLGPWIDRARPADVTPDSPQGRQWLEDELAKPEYQESFWVRLNRWFADLFDLGPDGLGVGAGTIVAAFAGVVILSFLIAMLLRVRRERAVPVAGGGPTGATSRSALDHRGLADRALGQARFDEAIVHAFRALAAQADECRLIALTPHHTAREVASAVASSLSDRARDSLADSLAGSLAGSLADSMAGAIPSGEIHQAATLFDAVRYGAACATEGQARRVLALDSALRETLRETRPRAAPRPVGTRVPA